MIAKMTLWVVLVVGMLAVVGAPMCLGAILRLLFLKMHRSLPTLLAAAILFFLQDRLQPGTMEKLLSSMMSAAPEGNAAMPIGVLIILIVYPFAGLAIPFIFAWGGASLVDRIRNKRNLNKASDAISEPALGADSSANQG